MVKQRQPSFSFVSNLRNEFGDEVAHCAPSLEFCTEWFISFAAAEYQRLSCTFLMDVIRLRKPLTFIYFITHADGRRVSITIIRLCDYVILSVRTIKPKRLKLKSPNLVQL